MKRYRYKSYEYVRSRICEGIMTKCGSYTSCLEPLTADDNFVNKSFLAHFSKGCLAGRNLPHQDAERVHVYGLVIRAP